MLSIDERGGRVAVRGAKADPAVGTPGGFSAAATDRPCRSRGRGCDAE